MAALHAPGALPLPPRYAVPNPRPGHVRVHESSPSDGGNASPPAPPKPRNDPARHQEIKRQMFGRASLPLLRKRVLLTVRN